MAITKVRYPFDKTGKASTNYVPAETHSVDHELNRAWAPAGGAFYGDSVVMRNADNGQKLYVGKDYILLYPDNENTAKLGLPIYSLISVTNKLVVNVSYDYQVVGGDISFSIPAIVKLLDDAQQDNRVVSWDNIWGKPVLFQPAPHLHDASTELVGMEYLVLALEELSRVINQGDVASHDVLWDYINRVLAELHALEKKQQDDYDEHQRQLDALVARCIDLQNQITANLNKLNAHMADKNNPHATTKAQVGLGLVDNFPTASQTQAETGVDNATFMTPLRTWQEIAKYSSLNIMPIVNAHIADKNNPHATTKAQVGLGNVENFPTATQVQAEAGTDAASFMTPQRVAQYAASKILPVLNAHIADKTNPHQVTKAQVGLGNVENFPTATQAQAEAGTDPASFMTPQRVAQYAASKILPQLTAHIADKSNPHATTKAQVGLGSVDNYPTASQAQAVAGTDNASFSTPLRVWQAITQYSNANIMPTVNAHLNNRSNPHNVTATQVGLGLVQNMRLATQAEAQAGGSNGVYMTPWSTYYEIMKFMPAYVDPIRANLQAQIDALNNRVNAITPNIQVISQNGGTTLTSLTPGARYVIWVDGNLGRDGKYGNPQQPSYVYNSAGQVLDSNPGRGIDWPDGNAPLTATFHIWAPSNGYVRFVLDGNVLINRITAIRMQ